MMKSMMPTNQNSHIVGRIIVTSLLNTIQLHMKLAKAPTIKKNNDLAVASALSSKRNSKPRMLKVAVNTNVKMLPTSNQSVAT